MNVRVELERFVPSVYTYSEFDWWQVPADKRSTTSGGFLGELLKDDGHLNILLLRALTTLDHYSFRSLDVDVWHQVYQHYLPAEERQQLGGFYTPDAVVTELLAEAGFTAELEGLCNKKFLDPACGSGTFITVALRRLLEHLDQDLPCHSYLGRFRTSWQRDQAVLDIISKNLYAMDIHPFAAFLTIVNVLFQVLRRYLNVKRSVKSYVLHLSVFAADSLDRGLRITSRLTLFKQMNSRIALSEKSYELYRQLLKQRFDYVFGNPPWGNVMKGALAPAYDEDRKKDLKRYFPVTSVGKFDIYGCFLELAVLILKKDGHIGFLTQNTFLDKDWAQGLRSLLSSRFDFLYLADLSPFGQLIFGAMNAPVFVAAGPKRSPARGHCQILIADDVRLDRHLTVDQRIMELMKSVRTARQTGEDFGGVTVALRPQDYFSQRGRDRWDLRVSIISHLDDLTPVLGDLWKMDQGATPGGALGIYQIDVDDTPDVELEFLYRSFKSIELRPYLQPPATKVMVYPYKVVENGDVRPAFRISKGRGVSRVRDALDFSVSIDNQEENLRLKYRGQPLAYKLLEHRIAKGLVDFPKLSVYLVNNYDTLFNRRFDKRPFTAFGRQWYEYWRPRDLKVLTNNSRIVMPTLINKRGPRFAIDRNGLMSDHATLYLYRHNFESPRDCVQTCV